MFMMLLRTVDQSSLACLVAALFGCPCRPLEVELLVCLDHFVREAISSLSWMQWACQARLLGGPACSVFALLRRTWPYP